MQKKVYTISQALSKAMKYCSLQDRCHHEMRTKLVQWGLGKEEADEVLVELVIQGFVNEERFARSYVRGKFNQKQWGRLRIRQGLRERFISEACIELGLSEIREETYKQTLQQVATKKSATLTGTTKRERSMKLARYLESKGYESTYIWELINRDE